MNDEDKQKVKQVAAKHSIGQPEDEHGIYYVVNRGIEVCCISENNPGGYQKKHYIDSNKTYYDIGIMYWVDQNTVEINTVSAVSGLENDPVDIQWMTEQLKWLFNEAEVTLPEIKLFEIDK